MGKKKKDKVILYFEEGCVQANAIAGLKQELKWGVVLTQPKKGKSVAHIIGDWYKNKEIIIKEMDKIKKTLLKK